MPRQPSGSAFSFPEVEAGIDETHHVAEGYDADILLRWGDGLFPDAPEFDPKAQTAAAQARQFGYNNDYVGYIPFEDSSEHGLLVVNHEYTNPHLMFPGIVTLAEGEMTLNPLTKEQVDIELAAHGGTIVEIKKTDGKWAVVKGRRAQPPRYRQHRDGHQRPRRRPRAPADQCRPDRYESLRHPQQLRRRRHALGHLCDGRREHPRLFRRRIAGRSSGSGEL
jgi:hypothetical protein